MHSYPLVEFWQSQRLELKLLMLRVFWNWHPTIQIIFWIRPPVSAWLGIAPCHWRRDNKKNLILLGVVALERINNQFSFFITTVELWNIKNDIVSSFNLFNESLWFCLRIKDFNCLRWWRCSAVGCVKRSNESMWLLIFIWINGDMIVSHGFEQTMSQETVDVCDEDSLICLEFTYLLGSCNFFGGHCWNCFFNF